MRLGQFALFFALSVTVCARSYGLRQQADMYGCNLMTAQYGCKNNWGYDLRIRGQCYDPVPPGQPQTIMWWASSPNVTTDFTLRTGEGPIGTDPTSYVPNERMPIYITAAKSGHFYEGLLMYAVDKNEKKVGDWEVPIGPDPDYIPHPGTICPNSVMHATARYKRRVTRFSYLTPPAGTGPITFRVMWKDGQPNPTYYGGFWIPPFNVTLNEATGATPSQWAVVSDGNSCDGYCSSIGSYCSPSNLGGALSTYDTSEILRVYPCDKAIFSECSTPGPRVIDNASRLCSFLDTRNCSNTGRGNPNPSCSVSSSPTQPLLCKCGGTASPAASSKPHFAWMLVLGLVSFFSLRNPHVTTAFCLIGLLSTAQAHNWIEGARGRAKDLQASTVQPALPPVHPLKIDMQIYMGQEIQIEWATAHGGTNYFVVLSQSDETQIDLHTEANLDDYINNAPSNSDHNGPANVTTSAYQKFGRNGQTTSLGTTYNAAISNSDPMYLGDRPTIWPLQLGGGGYQYSYVQGSIASDRRVSYTSAKYPWIEAVHRYTNVASTVDAIRLTIPARKGPGRYIIHYIWSSYRDIYDIDIHAAPTPGAKVANPYGVLANNSITYMQFDHCMFEGVQYLQQCWEAPTDGILARHKCDNDPACLAWALVPVKTLPPWNDYTQLPFMLGDPPAVNPGCNQSEFLAKIPPDGMASYTVQYYRSFDNGAAPPWTIMTDPDNIGFYSTCYVKLSPFQFDLPVTSLPLPAASDLPYRFGNKCIPCEDRGMNLTNGPRWRVADYCVDCDKEPVATKRPTNKIPVLASRMTNMTFNANTQCQMQGHEGACDKILWITLGGSAWMWEQDCWAKVATTPQCSKHGAWLNGGFDTRYVTEWFYREFQAAKNCMCWLASAGTPATKADATDGWNVFTLA